MTPPVAGADLRAAWGRAGQGGGAQGSQLVTPRTGAGLCSWPSTLLCQAWRRFECSAGVPCRQSPPHNNISCRWPGTPARPSLPQHALPEAAHLGGQLLAGRLATGGLAGGLLGAGHCDGLKLLRVGGAGCDRGWMAFRGIAMAFEGRGGGQLRAAFGPGSRGEAGSALAPPRRQQEAGPPAALQSPVVAFQSPYNAPTHTR